MITKRTMSAGLLCVALAAPFVLPSFAAEDKKKAKPSATLEVASEKSRLIHGGTAGKGVLHFNGQDYPFTYKSASVGVGAKAVKEMKATGNVYSLSKIEDFEGRYTAVTQTAMAGSANMSYTYKNGNGVTIVLQANVKGVGLGAGSGIATIELVK